MSEQSNEPIVEHGRIDLSESRKSLDSLDAPLPIAMEPAAPMMGLLVAGPENVLQPEPPAPVDIDD